MNLINSDSPGRYVNNILTLEYKYNAVRTMHNIN